MNLDDLERLEKAASGGWYIADGRPADLCGTSRHTAPGADWRVANFVYSEATECEADQRLAVAARNALPALLRVARAAKAFLERGEGSSGFSELCELRAAVRAVEEPEQRAAREGAEQP